MIFSSISKISLNLVSKRFIRKKANLKSWPNDWVPFHWSRPEKIPGYYDTGDLVTIQRPAKENILPQYRLSNSLNKLEPDNSARKIFSVDHAKPYDQTKALIQLHLERLGLIHEVDFSNSLEAKIVSLTYKLRHFQDYIKLKGESDAYTGHIRTLASNITNRRYRYLTDLKELHNERYERLINELQIAPKDNPINVKYLRPFRKKQMRKLAIEYSRDLRERKVEEFIRSLEKEKAEFEKERQETLQWIAEREKELGISVNQSSPT